MEWHETQKKLFFLLKIQDAAKSKPNAKTSTSTTSPNDHSFKEMPEEAGKRKNEIEKENFFPERTKKKKRKEKRGMDT